MRLNLFLSILLLIIAVGFLAYKITYVYTSPFKVQELGTDVIVVSERTVGLNVDTDALHFGMFRPTQGSTRSVNITNSMDFPVRVRVIKDKNHISDWISVSRTELVLKEKASEQVTFTCTVPEAQPEGNYTGSVFLEYYCSGPTCLKDIIRR